MLIGVINIFQQLHPARVKAKLSPALLDSVCYFHGARGHAVSGVTTILGYYRVQTTGLRVSSALKAEGFWMVLDSGPGPVS